MFQLRSAEVHRSHLDDLNDDDGTYSTQHGVTRRSVLMDLKYFDVCEGLLPDVMHDILEGCLQYELKLFLPHSVLLKHYFTVCFNNVIAWLHNISCFLIY